MTFERLLADKEVPHQKMRIVRIVNGLSIATAVTVFILGPYLYFITGYTSILYPALIEGSLFLLVTLLNRMEHHQAALRLMFTVHSLAVGYFTLILGPSSNVTAFTLFLCVSAYLIFSKTALILVNTIVVTMLLAVKTSHAFNLVPTLPLSSMAQENLTWTVDISVFVLTVSILYWYHSERKINEEEKRILRQRLDHANKSKSVYVRNTTHDLRSPMNIISGILQDYEIIGKNYGTREVNISFADFEELHVATRNLLQVINNTLDWSRIEAGEQEPVTNSSFKLQHWMKNEVQTYKRLGRGKTVTLMVDTGNLPPVIIIDHKKLRRILENLITNAIKFSKHQSTVTFTGTVKHKKLAFSITDEGPGIPEHMREKIFSPFTTDGNQNSESTGLGLPIAKELARILGAELTMKSKLGAGTTFTLTVPLTVPEKVEIAGTVRPEDEEGRINGKTILVVEDDMMNGELTRRFLSRAGATPVLIPSAISAIEYLRNNRLPDLILSDIRMQGMTGIELMKKIQAHPGWSEIPVIILTGEAFQEVYNQVMQAGASGCLIKPIQYPNLISVLNKVLSAETTVSA